MEGPRALAPGELDSLVALTNLVFRPEGGDMAAEFAYYLNERNAPHLRVYVEDGEVLAHCGYRLSDVLIFGAKVRVGCIGAVCTHPDRRGEGLGTQLFVDCLEAMKAEGADFAMISGGRGLYTRLEAVNVGRDTEFTFRADPVGDWEADVEVAPAAARDAAGLAALYRAEPIRFLRPPAEWADIVAGRWCMNRPARLFSIRRAGGLVAYAAVRATKPERDGEKGTHLGEFAGCRRALSSALPRLAAMGECPALIVHVYAGDAALATELGARGLEPSAAPASSGTVKLVNLPQLGERIKSLLVERAGERAERLEFKQAGDKLAVSLDAERLELSEADACRLVFGAKDSSERKLIEGRGELGKVLGAALPIELPWYGYNYA